ncbi:MAG TPA: hypothetical protein P5509_12375 [Bacteroidales bacterium]|nr:hypothetical protein [Bacteroidales bacterium]
MKRRIPTFENFLNEAKKLHGKVVKPKNVVFHTGNPMFRDKILKMGLVPQIGDSYRMHYEDNGVKPIPAIFAVNVGSIKDVYDSTYDDDIWEIDTKKANVKWFKDIHIYSDVAILTFETIPPNALKLVKKGTGKSTF